MKRNKKVLFLTQFAILLAIEAVVCFTPLGSLPIGPIVATLSGIPVIVTALMLGTGAGALMGFFFGLFSFLVWTLTPPNPVMAFLFTPFYSAGEFQGNFGSLLICFVPRILIGVVAGLAFKGLTRMSPKRDLLRYGLSGLLGSLANTVLVLGGIWIFFGTQYETVMGKAILAIIGTSILTNGLPEAVLSAFVAYTVCMPLNKALKEQG